MRIWNQLPLPSPSASRSPSRLLKKLLNLQLLLRLLWAPFDMGVSQLQYIISSQPRVWTHFSFVFCICGRILHYWATCGNPNTQSVCVFSVTCHARLFATPWTVAHQAPLSGGLCWQESWSELPFPPPGDLPDPGTEHASLVSPALAGRFFTAERSRKQTYNI